MNEELKQKWKEIKEKCIMAIVVLRFVYIRTKNKNSHVEIQEIGNVESGLKAILLLTEAGFVKDDGGNFTITESGIDVLKYQESLTGR
jgi:hypothetical protein